MAPNGISILQESVKRRFPLDDEWVPFDDPKAFAVSSTVSDIIQEILQRHASGIHFREYNAGPNLDMQMTDHGFDIDIEVDWKTGIIFGGNEWNCGTWMDKMVSYFLRSTHSVLFTNVRGKPREKVSEPGLEDGQELHETELPSKLSVFSSQLCGG